MKLTHWETAQLCQGLALLLHSGVTMADGLFLLAREADAERQTLLKDLGKALDRGISPDEAIAQCGAFPELAVAMVRTGQYTGAMEQALTYLAQYYDSRVRTLRQIRRALTYPCLLFVLMLAVLLVLLIRVLPVFDSVYASLGTGLTGIAGGLLDLGYLLKQALPALALLLGLVGVLAAVCRISPSLRERISRWYLCRFGDLGLAQKFHNAQFSQAMAMALGSGMTPDAAIDLASGLLAHVPGAAARCLRCREQFDAQENLPQALEEASLMPAVHCRLLSLALEGSSKDQVLEDIARRMQEEAMEALEDKISRIEPAMVLICSGLVGAILLAVMLPLMDMLSSLG